MKPGQKKEYRHHIKKANADLTAKNNKLKRRNAVLETQYDTLKASHTKLVEALQEIIGDYQESPHSFTVPDIHERIEQALSEAEKI